MVVFWVVAPCNLRLIALIMEVSSTSETSVKFYYTTRCNNPEDNHLHTRRRENLKSHEYKDVFEGPISSPSFFFRQLCV
jgi:hypothetical protein